MLVEALAVAAALVGGTNLHLAASEIAGRPVTVYCVKGIQTGTGHAADGLAWLDDGIMQLSKEVCDVFYATRGVTPAERGAALLVFTHEAIHMSGITDESITECKAMRMVGKVSILYFGYRPGRLLHDTMAGALTYHRSLPADYRKVC